MPLTTIYDGGTRIVGNSTAINEVLHPNVLSYVRLVISEGYNPSWERINALNNLTLSLIANGLWDKMDAMYPFIGGTTGNQHRYNLRDPRALTAAFMITWGGTVTFSDNGNQGNNIDGFGNTNLIPSTHVASATSIHMSCYINIASVPAGLGRLALGASSGGVSDFGTSPSVGNRYYAQINNSGIIDSGVATTGFYCASRISNTDSRLYRNGVQVGTTSATAASASTGSIGIHARGNGSFPSNNRIAFVSIGDGLNAVEARTLYQLVQIYQTALGRQV